MDIKKISLPLMCLGLTACGGATSNPTPSTPLTPSTVVPTSTVAPISLSSSQEVKREMHNYSVYSSGVDYPSTFWEAPEYRYDESLDKEGCKALYIRSDYDGEESYAFAYLGIPEDGKVIHPAVLLLHGGGGTAYVEWVNAWVDRGYVALAVDLEGHVPLESGKITDYPANLYTSSQYRTPHNTNLADDNVDIDKTWLYYATKTGIIANSFLHNLEGVDPYKIGVCGISWGGFITSIIGGYDDRFAFMIPIYCHIGISEASTPIAGYLMSHPLFKIFDKTEALSLISTPTNLIVSNADIHGSLTAATELKDIMQNCSLSIIDRFPHSHADALYEIEPYNFANSVLANQEQISFIDLLDEKVQVNIPDDYEVLSTTIYYTSDKVGYQAQWYKKEGTIEEGIVNTNLESDVAAYYVSIMDGLGSIHTSNLVIR